jgi:hypothetical protein
MTAKATLQVAGDASVLEFGHLQILTLVVGQRVVP